MIAKHKEQLTKHRTEESLRLLEISNLLVSLLLTSMSNFKDISVHDLNIILEACWNFKPIFLKNSYTSLFVVQTVRIKIMFKSRQCFPVMLASFYLLVLAGKKKYSIKVMLGIIM